MINGFIDLALLVDIPWQLSLVMQTWTWRRKLSDLAILNVLTSIILKTGADERMVVIKYYTE